MEEIKELTDEEVMIKEHQELLLMSPDELSEIIIKTVTNLLEDGLAETTEDAFTKSLIFLSFPYSGKGELTKEELYKTVNKILEYIQKKEVIN